MHKLKWTQQQHKHRFGVKDPRRGDGKHTEIRKASAERKGGRGGRKRGGRESGKNRGEAGGAWAGLSDRRKSGCAGLQVNGRRKAPAGCLRQAWALLFYHLGDKSSTDSQLIFNTAQTTRHFTAEHTPTSGGEKDGREKKRRWRGIRNT